MANEKRSIATKLTEWKELYADNAEFVEYAEGELAKLATKAAKAKERAAEKKVAGDELRAVIETILKEATEPMTREMVLDCINDPEGELTVAKVGNRISQLVKLGLVSKTSVKVEEDGKTKTKTAYVYGTVETADAE